MNSTHKTLLAVILTFASTAAMAALVQIENNDIFRNGTLYTDPSLNTREGSIVTFIILTDYDKPLSFRKGKAYSHVDKSAYDCDKKLVKSLFDIHLDGHMGQGNPVNQYQPSGEWNEVNPGTRGEQDWKTACGRK